MISLGRLFSDESPRDETPRDDSEPLRRAVGLLVQGIEIHTPAFDQEDYTWFRSEMASAQRRLEGHPVGEDLRTAVGDAIRSLGEYNRRTSDHIRTRITELEGIISALFASVEHLVSSSDSSTHKLKEIRFNLSTAAKANDLRTVKTHLSGCLKQIEDEVEAHKQASEAGKALLAAGPEGVKTQVNCGQRALALDSLTGLPDRAAAEATLAEVAQTTGSGVVVIFVLSRLAQINLRFGREAGDHLLDHLSTYLGSGSNPEDGLFRWTGPVLLMIIRRDVSFDHVRIEMRKLVADLPKQEVRAGTRHASIPLSVSWAAYPITSPMDRMISRIEGFATNRTGEEARAAK